MNNNIKTNENGTDFTVETATQANERLTEMKHEIEQDVNVTYPMGTHVDNINSLEEAHCVSITTSDLTVGDIVSHFPMDDWDNEMAEVEDVVDQLEGAIIRLEEMVDVQCSNGNWNYDPYMHGMANGMIFALAMMKDEDPVYLDAPDTWLKDIKSEPTPSAQSEECDQDPTDNYERSMKGM